MGKSDDLKTELHEVFPVLFGADPVDRTAFVGKYDALLTYASTVSEPFIKPDTIRYQTILMSSCLLLLTLQMFSVREVKVLDALVSIDERLLFAYSAFIGLIAVVFLTKVWLDRERSVFLRMRSVTTPGELQDLVNLGMLKRTVQRYFWLEVFDSVGATYQSYHTALANAGGRQNTFKHVPLQGYTLNLTAIAKTPELAQEIARLSEHLSSIKSRLEIDEAEFQTQAKRIVEEDQATREGLDELEIAFRGQDAHSRIRKLFEETLEPWFLARTDLAREELTVVLGGTGEFEKVESLKLVLQRILKIRSYYAVAEVVVPVALAALAIAYTYWK